MGWLLSFHLGGLPDQASSGVAVMTDDEARWDERMMTMMMMMMLMLISFLRSLFSPLTTDEGETDPEKAQKIQEMIAILRKVSTRPFLIGMPLSIERHPSDVGYLADTTLTIQTELKYARRCAIAFSMLVAIVVVIVVICVAVTVKRG